MNKSLTFDYLDTFSCKLVFTKVVRKSQWSASLYTEVAFVCLNLLEVFMKYRINEIPSEKLLQLLV